MSQEVSIIGVNWEKICANKNSHMSADDFYSEELGIVVGLDYDLPFDNRSVCIRAWECILLLRKNWESSSSQALIETFGAVCLYDVEHHVTDLELPRGQDGKEWLAGDFVGSALSPDTVSQLATKWNEVDFAEVQLHFGKGHAKVFRGKVHGVKIQIEEEFQNFKNYLESWQSIFIDAASKGFGIAVWLQ